ncbi:MAG TPA: hydantoinase B/oxoprolinase family protein [Acidimicrobiales bacterium]
MTPFSLEIFRHLLTGVAEEMGAALMRAAFSPNIKERLDFSCALFDDGGRLLAQASHIPVHLGSMPALLRWVLDHCDLAPGDVWLANDPFRGGTHLPDVTAISPFYRGGRLVALAANRAHHSDIGGSTPGSMPLSVDIFQEGLILPPVPLFRRGRRQQAVWDLLLANVRTPQEREGDLEAQAAANRIAHRRLAETFDRYGEAWVAQHQEAILEYSDRLTRAALARLPEGTWRFEDELEAADGGAIPIRVAVTLGQGEAVCDFTGTAPLGHHCLNAPRSVTEAAVYYVFRCLTGDHVPPNDGCFRPIRVVIPPGCLLAAESPFGVAGGNVETSQRVVDVVLGALAQAMPECIPAASAGTMNNLSFGGDAPLPFTYYETMGGGCGASAEGPGRSAVQTHMTNTRNTPVEALEMAFPVRVRRYAVRRGSGGAGRYRGGDGLVRELEFTSPARVTVLSDRRQAGPWGLQGGSPGAPGRNLLNGQPVPGKTTLDVQPGDVLTVETPGGGGFGISN